MNIESQIHCNGLKFKFLMIQEKNKMLSRADILRWIADTVDMQVKKIEDLGDGVCYCLLVNQHHGSKILPETSINRAPKTELQMLANYRALQSALNRLKVVRSFDASRLVKQKYQDNWQFASWLYRLLNKSSTIEPPSIPAGKRSHSDLLYTQMMRDPLAPLVVQRNSGQVTPVGGKSSVSSELFSSNYAAIIDRLRDILSKDETDSEKVKQLRLLLNVQDRPREEQIDTEIKELITDEKATAGELDGTNSPLQLKF